MASEISAKAQRIQPLHILHLQSKTMIASASLFLALLLSPASIESSQKVTAKNSVAEIVRTFVILSADPKKFKYDLQIQTDDAIDREKFCALIKSSLDRTCDPKRPTIAAVVGKPHDSIDNLITLVESIESEFSKKGRWQFKINTTMSKEALNLNLNFLRQENEDEPPNQTH